VDPRTIDAAVSHDNAVVGESILLIRENGPTIRTNDSMAVRRLGMFSQPRRYGPRRSDIAKSSRDRSASRYLSGRNLIEALFDGPSKVQIHR